MGKNNAAKKGKQKEPPAIPVGAPAPPPSSPPPAISSPPAAHHIPRPATIYTIEEPEDAEDLAGDLVEGVEGSWQSINPSDGWAADAPANGNGNLGDTGWEAAMPSRPPQSVLKKTGGGKELAKPRQPHPPSNWDSEFGASTGNKENPPADGWAHADPQDTWIPDDDEDDEWDDQESGHGQWGANDGWNSNTDGWSRPSHSATWAHAVSAHSGRPQVMSHVPTSGWQSWGEEARRLPKVTFDPAIPPSPSSTRSKPVSFQLQRSQTLGDLLNNPQQNQQPYPMPPTGGTWVPSVGSNWQQHRSSQHWGLRQQPQHEPLRRQEHHHKHEDKMNKNDPQRSQMQQQSRRRQEEVHDVWGLGDGWSDLQDEEEQQDMTQDDWGRRVHFSPGAPRASTLPSSAPSVAPSAVVENFTVNALPQNKLGLSTIPMSKTLSYAYSGTTPSTESEPGRAAMQRITDFQFIESQGEALKSVQSAFYNKERKAAERFHWLFPEGKDERVSSLLNWINSVSFGIASFGLQKFLQTRERGALIVNAAYRPVHSPNEPAFDWVTWNQIQRTMDRILQESVGYYNPAMHVIIFVLLPSTSGNSVAIWRRKLSIPNNIRLAYQAQITQAMASLRKEYPVFVDELPVSPEPIPPPPPKKKRKWYKLWLSS